MKQKILFTHIITQAIDFVFNMEILSKYIHQFVLH